MNNIQEFSDPEDGLHIGDGELVFSIMKFSYSKAVAAKITADPYYSHPAEDEEWEIMKAMIWDEETEQWNPTSDSHMEMLYEDSYWGEILVDEILDFIQGRGEQGL